MNFMFVFLNYFQNSTTFIQEVNKILNKNVVTMKNVERKDAVTLLTFLLQEKPRTVSSSYEN